MKNDQDDVPTASVGVWIGLIVTAALSFWCQASVTEERFVPALNLISTRYSIPNAVAGATLMAAGCSSPELFSSIVSLFITKSSLGLGTIVGSEIFNQLIICAGAVFASKSGRLELDRAVVIREVSFYALGILLLFLALQDTRPIPGDPEEHIFISFGDSLMVFVGYIAYVLVCANMDAVVAFFAPKPSGGLKKNGLSASYGALNIVTQTSIAVGEATPFMHEKHNLVSEPKGNFQTVEFFRTKTGEKAPMDKQYSSAATADAGFGRRESALSQTFRNMVARFSDGVSIRAFEFLLHTEKPSDEHGLYDVEVNTFEERLSCFMWQRSYFYSKARLATHGWHLRWFSLKAQKMYSVPNRIRCEKHKISYPVFEEVNVDPTRLIIQIVSPEEGNHDFFLLCPSKDIFEQVVNKMAAMIALNMENEGDGMFPEESAREGGEGEASTHVEMESLVDFPADGSWPEIIFFVLLFPLRFLMHYTVPDVRTLDRHGVPMATLFNAWIAVLMCLLWLIVGSYAMVASLEGLASLVDIPDAVIGVTVSAAGTSLPNYVASKVAAQNGFGNMAVSNAFGSNTFNIMIGLGLPWVLYTSFGSHFQPYSGLRNEGIVESVVIMGSVLLLFLALVIPSGFVLYKWHGVVFVLSYIAYLAFAIGQVYIK